MEMHQIRYVLAAAEHLNFTRAASVCEVSQPALTKGIKALETELDAPLFHREGRRIIVSQFGLSMLPHLRQIAAEADAARDLAQRYHLLNEVPVRLGVQSTIGPARFSELFGAFNKAHGEVELAVSQGTTRSLIEEMQADALDLAVVTRLPDLGDALTLTPLYTERYAVILPKDHPLGALDQVSLADLNGQPYIDRLECEMREIVRETCNARSVDLYARFRAERDDWVQSMVRSGLGFAFMPDQSITQEGLVVRPLVDPVVERQVCLASVPGRPFAPAAAALVRLARSFGWAA